MKRILAIVPARGGSKGVVGKNIRIINGKPLIGWTLDAAKNSKYIDRILLSSDDNKIIEVAENYDIEAMKRPMELAGDKSSVIHTMKYVINELRGKGYSPDAVMLLQCTSPLRKTKHIDEAIDMFLKSYEVCDSVISVTNMEHPVRWIRKINESGFMENYINYSEMGQNDIRQNFSQLYRLNGAIYIIKTEVLLNSMSLQTEKTIPYVMDEISSIDIDTEYDLMLAEKLMTIV